jgi:hypothetical protein
MLYEVVKDFPHSLLFEEEGPFISLYQPTFRHSPENNRDPIIFKNLIRTVENSLKQKYQKYNYASLLKPFYQIRDDKGFWNKMADGLAILANPHKCIVYKVQKPVQELAVVADTPHIKPLIRVFQSTDKYQMLCLSRSKFSLYEGNRYGFEEIEINPEIPRTMEEVLGTEHTESYLTQGSFSSAGGSGIYYGYGGKEEADLDAAKYFRYIDKLVRDNYSKRSQEPLILVSLAENQGLFRKISHNQYLLAEGIEGSCDSWAMEGLKEKAWEITLPIFLEKTTKLLDSFEKAKADLTGSADLAQVVAAAVENRVAILLLESDRIIPGKINYDSGEIIAEDVTALDTDILDDLAKLVLKYRGEVVVLPPEKMPGNTGLAAIYR